MDACPTCPNRHHADTLEALADAAKGSLVFRVFAPVLRKRAEQVREAGCNNWKTLEETVRDSEGREINRQVVSSCMRDKMVGYLNDIHMHAHLTGKAAESHRNVVAEGFSYIAGRPIRGDGKSLPDDWRELVGIEDGQRKAPAALADGERGGGGGSTGVGGDPAAEEWGG